MELLYGITGASGFIGSHLRERIENFISLDRTGKTKKADLVIDLAAYGNMADHKSDPAKIYKANTLRVAKILEQLKGAKYIYMSTSSVELPVQTFYSASKKATEEMIQIAVRDWGVKACIARPFSVTGAGEQWDHLIPKLLTSCLTGVEIPFVPEPVHDFIDVDDVAEALITISQKGLFEGEIYDIGSQIQTSNARIKELAEEISGKKANLRYVDSMRKYDSNKWRSNTSMMQKLGWRPKKSLTRSIKEEYELIKYAQG